jgi:hypothetical protein
MTMRAMLAAARHYHRDAYEVIVDFSIPVGYLDAVKKLLLGEPFYYIVLRPSEAVCAHRAATRAEGAIADYESYRDFYSEFMADDEATIADDDASPSELAERIRKGLTQGRFKIPHTLAQDEGVQ